MRNKTVAIVICTEAGTLECMSQLLVKSIRTFGGALKDASIYSIQPRNPKPLSSKTLEVFKEYQVHHEYLQLNEKYPNYGLANKVVACEHYSRELSEDCLMFLDSDHVVFNDLGSLLAEPMKDVQIRVVGQKGAGTDGNDENAAYWNKLFTICGVTNPNFVETGIDGNRIFSYYNSGLIFARRASGIFQQWKNNFEKIMDSGLQPEQGLFFVEQSVLSATIEGMGLSVHQLPDSFDYSPQKHFHLSGENKQLSPDQIHTFHYHRLFNPPNRIDQERDFAAFKGAKFDWLKQELINCDINPRPFYEPWELDLLRQKEDILQSIKAQQSN
jgi:hypothetical protein